MWVIILNNGSVKAAITARTSLIKIILRKSEIPSRIKILVRCNPETSESLWFKKVAKTTAKCKIIVIEFEDYCWGFDGCWISCVRQWKKYY